MSADRSTGSTADGHDPRGGSTLPASSLVRSRPFLAFVPALAVGIVVYAAYVLTHPFPALGGGLFLAMAEAVAENGYALPARVPGYTPGGIPFAYPPLGFYLLAPLLDTGVSPLALARVLPGVFRIVALMPTYALGRALSVRTDKPASRP